MMGEYSAASFGYCRPPLLKVTERAPRLDTISRAYFATGRARALRRSWSCVQCILPGTAGLSMVIDLIGRLHE
jgi:hypothetical protein